MTVNFIAGQTLTAQQLNNAFAGTLPITGGELKGDLVVPNLNVLNPVAISNGGTGSNTPTGAMQTLQYQFAGANARALQDKFSDTVSVKDFGAMGNGIHDDTAAFQKAANSGKALFVPAGIYSLTTTINFNAGMCSISGEAKGNTILVFSSGGIAKQFANVNGETCNIKNLSIQTTSINPYAAIRLYRTDTNAAFEDEINIEHITVSCSGGAHTSTNTFKYGIRLEYVRFTKIVNCFLWGQEGYNPISENPNAVAGISLVCANTIPQFGFGLINNWVTSWSRGVDAVGWFEGFYVSGGEYWNLYYGFYFNRPAPSGQTPMAGTVKLSNFHCNASKTPFFLDNCSGAGINNCDIQNGVGGGLDGGSLIVLIDSPRSTVTGCSIANYYTNGCNGIYLQNSNGVAAIGNSINNITSSAIVVASSKNVILNGNTIDNPDFTPSYGVYATDDSTGLIAKNQLNANTLCQPGGMMYDPPRIQVSASVTLTAGANTITVTPPRTLSFVPNSVSILTEYNSAGAVQAYYNYSKSTTSSLSFTLNAAAAGTYRYSVEYPLN